MTTPTLEWLEENLAACRDSTNSLKPLPIRMVKKQGVRKLARLTREKHFCPDCPRAPYGSREHGCVFAPPADESESLDWKMLWDRNRNPRY